MLEQLIGPSDRLGISDSVRPAEGPFASRGSCKDKASRKDNLVSAVIVAEPIFQGKQSRECDQGTLQSRHLGFVDPVLASSGCMVYV